MLLLVVEWNHLIRKRIKGMKLINKWKIMIPTWFIGIWFFFGIFGWTLVIAILLTIIQYRQKKKILFKTDELMILHNNLEDMYHNLKNENDVTYKEYIKELEEKKCELEKTVSFLKNKNEEFNFANFHESNLELEDKEKELLKWKEQKESADNEINRLNALLKNKELQIENLKNNISDYVNKKYKEKWEEYGEKFLKRKKEFEQELSDIQSKINTERIKQEELFLLESKKEKLEEEKNEIQSEIDSIQEELKILNDKSIEKYYIFSEYDGMTSQDCINKIFVLKEKEKSLRKNERDIDFIYEFERKKTKPRVTKQMLRNFNADCDNIISNINSSNIDNIRKKIQKSYETINNLYSDYYASITEEMLSIKLEKATLLYTAELKKQQEREIQKEIKEQMIEEAKAQKEIEEQKKKIEKDLQQHLGEVNRMMKYMQKTQADAEKQIYINKIKELEEKIKVLESDKEVVLEREANAKAGFVYIISNIGSFGEDIYKIGMTRRLEPMDRIRELSSASVPFEFDVHAMIFSSDAPELETTLHRYFSDRAVNKVNPRKEFYNVDIDEIEKVVKENYNDAVQFTKIPIAAEYRQSLSLMGNE
jgi:T5orf172 domain.